MAHIMMEIEQLLINNQIDCNNNQHIGGLSWLVQNHRDQQIRHLATVTLARCFRRQERRGGGVRPQINSNMVRRVQKYYRDMQSNMY